MTAPGKRVEERLAEQLHVAGQHDQPRAALGQPVGQRPIARATVGVVRAREHAGRHPTRGGALQRGRPAHVGGDRHDLGLSPVHGVEQRLQVGARAGDQHGDG